LCYSNFVGTVNGLKRKGFPIRYPQFLRDPNIVDA
jgi:hypothetical protein